MTQVSETIADGFSVLRRARGPDLESLTDALTEKAEGYPGITLYTPSEDDNRSTEIRLVTSRYVIEAKMLIGHLGREAVYKALEGDPALASKVPLTTGRALPLRTLPSGDHLLGFRLDDHSAGAMAENCARIKGILARMAELGEAQSQALWLPPTASNLTMAIITSDTPYPVVETMHETIAEHAGLPFLAKRVHALPRLPQAPELPSTADVL